MSQHTDRSSVSRGAASKAEAYFAKYHGRDAFDVRGDTSADSEDIYRAIAGGEAEEAALEAQLADLDRDLAERMSLNSQRSSRPTSAEHGRGDLTDRSTVSAKSTSQRSAYAQKKSAAEIRMAFRSERTQSASAVHPVARVSSPSMAPAKRRARTASDQGNRGHYARPPSNKSTNKNKALPGIATTPSNPSSSRTNSAGSSRGKALPSIQQTGSRPSSMESGASRRQPNIQALQRAHERQHNERQHAGLSQLPRQSSTVSLDIVSVDSRDIYGLDADVERPLEQPRDQHPPSAQSYASHGMPPPQHGMPPPQHGMPPPQHGMPPPPHGMPHNHRMPPPHGHGIPPQHNHGMPSPQHGMPPPEHGMPPPQHGMPPPQHGMPPPQHGMPPPQHGMPPPQHGMPPPQHGMPPPQRGMPPPQHGMPPPQRGMPPPQHGMPPPQHGMPPPQHNQMYGPPTHGYPHHSQQPGYAPPHPSAQHTMRGGPPSTGAPQPQYRGMPSYHFQQAGLPQFPFPQHSVAPGGQAPGGQAPMYALPMEGAPAPYYLVPAHSMPGGGYPPEHSVYVAGLPPYLQGGGGGGEQASARNTTPLTASPGATAPSPGGGPMQQDSATLSPPAAEPSSSEARGGSSEDGGLNDPNDDDEASPRQGASEDRYSGDESDHGELEHHRIVRTDLHHLLLE